MSHIATREPPHLVIDLGDRVGQQLFGDQTNVGLAQPARKKVNATGPYALDMIEPDLADVGQDFAPGRVAQSIVPEGVDEDRTPAVLTDVADPVGRVPGI